MNNILLKLNKLLNNPFIRFFPFLFLYIGILFIFSKDTLVGDEGRYLLYAKNLAQGYYSPPFPNISLWNGPGYPILILPFVAFNGSYLIIRLLNPILLYFSLILIFKTCLNYTSNRTANYTTILFGLYYPIFEYISVILTEIFVIFLISLFSYFITKAYHSSKRNNWFIFSAGLVLGYIALTKILFGYVLVIGIVLFFIISIYRIATKRILYVFIVALLVTTPYLFYTYNLTGKIFYWSNAGGSSLYPLSTPYQNEWGDWFSSSSFKTLEERKDNHEVFLKSIENLDPIQKDKALKKQALNNINNHPKKFFLNWISNWGRMFFSYPYSYANQNPKTFFTLIPNMFIVVFIVIFSILGFINHKSIPWSLKVLLFIAFIYLLGSSFLSAYRRMFYIILPIVSVWLAFIFHHFIKVENK